MTHTQTVALILDGTRRTGVLFHALTEAKRANLAKIGREYMIAHATDQSVLRRSNLDALASRVLGVATI